MIKASFPKKIAVMHDDTPKIRPPATHVISFGLIRAKVKVTVSVMKAADSGRNGVSARSSVIAANISAPSVANKTTFLDLLFIFYSFAELSDNRIARD